MVIIIVPAAMTATALLQMLLVMIDSLIQTITRPSITVSVTVTVTSQSSGGVSESYLFVLW